MDEPSRHVVRFLEALSTHQWGGTLYHGPAGLWSKLIRRGLQPSRPCITTTAAPSPTLVLGLYATIADGRELDFEVELRHDGESWLIETDVRVDRLEGEGQRVVRSFPVRRATTLDDCLTELGGAVTDLARCDDVLDEDL